MTQPPGSQAVAPSSSARMETRSRFTGAGGLDLAARRWGPAGAPRAAVAVVHGWGEHSGRYPRVVAALTAAGFAVHGFDLRGHGRSPGRRGHIDGWSDYREDLGAYLEHVRGQEGPALPVFPYGHSIGGAIVLEYGLHHPDTFDGAIASSPALEPKGVRNPVLEGLAAGMSRVWPTFSLTVAMEDDALTRDPQIVAETRADPLNHRRLTTRATTESLRTLAWIKGHAGEWRPPLSIFHGTGDRIADPSATVAFAEDARTGGAPDVELRLYEGSYHEAHNDLDAHRVLADVVDWLDRHLAQRIHD